MEWRKRWNEEERETRKCGRESERWTETKVSRHLKENLPFHRADLKNKAGEQTHKSSLRLCEESRPAGCYIRSPRVFFIIPLNHWHKRSILLHTRKRLTEDSLFGGKGKFLPLFTDFINILLAANAHESTCKRICERLHERLRQVHSRESTAAPPGTAEAITHKGDYPVVFISWRTHNIFPSSGHTSGTRNNVSRAGTRRSDFTYITVPEGVLFMLKRGETRRRKKR